MLHVSSHIVDFSAEKERDFRAQKESISGRKRSDFSAQKGDFWAIFWALERRFQGLGYIQIVPFRTGPYTRPISRPSGAYRGVSQ